MGEAKTLRNIAGRLAPDRSLELLTTDKGRGSLIADLARRIGRREREIELLRKVKEKLERIRDEGVHKRETVRVEADLPVWMVKKVRRDAGEDGEDVFTNVEQVPGHLIDISEGGRRCAVVGSKPRWGTSSNFGRWIRRSGFRRCCLGCSTWKRRKALTGGSITSILSIRR